MDRKKCREIVDTRIVEKCEGAVENGSGVNGRKRGVERVTGDCISPLNTRLGQYWSLVRPFQVHVDFSTPKNRS